MFDRLVESSKSKQRSRSGRLFVLTGFFYAMLLSILAIWTILGFSPGLAEEVDWTRLMPPVLYTAPQPVIQRTVQQQSQVVVGFIPPKGDKEISPLKDLPPVRTSSETQFTGLISKPGEPSGGLIPGINFSAVSDHGAPAPPPPKPTPEPTPEVKPTPRPLLKVSIGVTQGLATYKVKPQYPAIARAAHAEGPVQVQVLISEEGRVINADVLSGNPLLRQAALDAARQWVFRPTLLSNVPVKVQGLLTFNFTLN